MYLPQKQGATPENKLVQKNIYPARLIVPLGRINAKIVKSNRDRVLKFGLFP